MVLTVALKGFERRLERMVEGTFARIFRSGLRPVELGRRIVREMDDGRSVGVRGRTTVPNDFTVWLSEDDLEGFAEINDSLCRELCDAAREHARDERYKFMGPVVVRLSLHPKMKKGAFQIEARMKEGVGGSGAGSILLPDRARVPLTQHVMRIGRLPECDITVNDQNVSRHHAELRPYGDTYLVVDLGSTNGIRVNGSRVAEHELQDGDEITLGNTTLGFEAS
jgi:hypothetical protein